MLTAGHCFEDNNPSKNGCAAPNHGLKIILGELDKGNVGGYEVQKSKLSGALMLIWETKGNP